jgi:signal peptidase I
MARGEYAPGSKRPYMLAVVAAIIVFILVAPVRVHGDNMAPALKDGDVVIIHKASYYDEKLPAYDDFVCFKRSFAPDAADGSREYRIARVVGLPGDVIEIRGGEVYRNGGKVHGVVLSADEAEGVSGTREIASGEVFVLNYNETDEVDSRDEQVETLLENIRGEVIFRVWPIGKIGVVR